MDAGLSVLHVVQYFETGGLERMVLSLAQSLGARGVRNSVMAYVSDGPLRARFEDLGVKTFFVSSKKGVDWRVSRAVHRLLRTGDFDVLHTHHVGPFLYGCAPARLCRLPHVHTEHSHEFYDSPRLRAVGRAMDHFASVVCVADEVARYRAEVFGRVPLVIGNGVEVPKRDPEARRRTRRLLGADDETFVVGCVARLSPEKDQLGLVRAFAEFRKLHERAILVLVGGALDRDYEKEIRKSVASSQLETAVVLLGDRDDVDDLYWGFDAVALFSRREGLPLSLLEAMARGLPVVATAVGEIPALLAGGGGHVVERGDGAGMARALEDYASSSGRALKDGRRAKQIVCESYSREKMASGYERLYRWLGRKTAEGSLFNGGG